MLTCKKDLFQIDENVTFINGAYMSPLLTSSIELGLLGMLTKTTPSKLTTEDFFQMTDTVRSLYAQLINVSSPDSVALAASASYGLANVAQNIPLKRGDEILIVEDQFPSNYYCWAQRAKETNASIRTIPSPSYEEQESWSDRLCDAISTRTKVVSIPHVHWGDGSLFDLERISQKVHEHDGYLIIDGTQSVGALPLDNAKVQADAIICGAYKWLLGPYGAGLAYYNERFLQGKPIEQSWINRKDSHEFRYLTNYQEEYRAGARRYEVGEASDFIKLPMIANGLEHLIKWGPQHIQDYCHTLVAPILPELRAHGYKINDHIAYHLFGIRMSHVDMAAIQQSVQAANISVSYRGDAMRVSPNVYNTHDDIGRLANILIQAV